MEQKASVENFHVPLETLQTIVGEFGFTLVTQQLLTGGFSSSNFRCSLKVRSGTALPQQLSIASLTAACLEIGCL